MMKDLSSYILETTDKYLSPWTNGVLAMGDDATFLKTVWHYDIAQLEELKGQTESDLNLCKKSVSRGGILKAIWKKDKMNLEWRLKCLNQIIKSKTKEPDYMPSQYK